MVEKILNAIAEKYPLKEKEVGEFSTFKANGMTFYCSAYEAEGLGHVSLMLASGFFGLMKMDTLIIAPETKDLPLLSYDRIYAMGNDTLIMELYDTMLGEADCSKMEETKQKYAAMPDRFKEGEEPKHWYDDIRFSQSIAKKGKKKHNFDELTLAYVKAYLNTEAKPCEKGEKIVKTARYADGLLSNGGPATDVLKKSLGKEKTVKLFKNVLFATQE